MIALIIGGLAVFIVFFVLFYVKKYKEVKNKFPQMTIFFDEKYNLSWRIEDFVDDYFIKHQKKIKNFYKVAKRHEKYKSIVRKSVINKLFNKKMKHIFDDKIFHFKLKRVNYNINLNRNLSIPLKKEIAQMQSFEEISCDIKWIEDRVKKLKDIGFVSILSKYFCEDQRKLMTPKLKKKIKKRDNYTCQICGKRMNPTSKEVEVDHIIPVSKGGKSVPENLQVLCRSCNLKKGDKIIDVKKEAQKVAENESKNEVTTKTEVNVVAETTNKTPPEPQQKSKQKKTKKAQNTAIIEYKEQIKILALNNFKSLDDFFAEIRAKNMNKSSKNNNILSLDEIKNFVNSVVTFSKKEKEKEKNEAQFLAENEEKTANLAKNFDLSEENLFCEKVEKNATIKAETVILQDEKEETFDTNFAQNQKFLSFTEIQKFIASLYSENEENSDKS